jgi:hypothetical protein
MRLFLSKFSPEVRFKFVFTKWLVKILCKQLGEWGLTQFPKVNATALWNLDLIYKTFKGCPNPELSHHINTKVLEEAGINFAPEPSRR